MFLHSVHGHFKFKYPWLDYHFGNACTSVLDSNLFFMILSWNAPNIIS